MVTSRPLNEIQLPILKKIDGQFLSYYWGSHAHPHTQGDGDVNESELLVRKD